MGRSPLPPPYVHHSLYLLWVIQWRENTDLSLPGKKGWVAPGHIVSEGQDILGRMSEKDGEGLAT